MIKARSYLKTNDFRGRWPRRPCAAMRVRRVGPEATRTPGFPVLGYGLGLSPLTSHKWKTLLKNIIWFANTSTPIYKSLSDTRCYRRVL